MRVSVLIPTYNRSAFLSECLNSIISQTFPPFEIIVIDDGSDDDTPKLLERYVDKINILTQHNSGKSAALNNALNHVSGDAIWVFDDDDVALPGGLMQLVRALENAPTAGFSFGNFYWSSPDGKGTLKPQRLESCPIVTDDEIFIRLLEGCFFRHTACLVRTECYRQLGGFCVDQARSQDYEFQIRLCRQFSGVQVSAPVMLFRIHAGARGSRANIHRADLRPDISLAYNQIFFSKLREILKLEEYLPKSKQNLLLTPRLRREAVLQRACSMGRQALWDELFEDMIMSAREHCEPLSLREKDICARVFSWPIAMRHPPDPNYFSCLRNKLSDQSGLEIRAACARGMYWAFAQECRDRNYLSAVRLLEYLFRLAGVAGLIQAVRERLRRSNAKEDES